MKTKSKRNCRIILGLSLGTLVTTSTTLRADDRDDKIEDAYKNSYVYRTQLRESDVSISSKHGTVTLKGTVDSADQKRLAEDTAATSSDPGSKHDEGVRADGVDRFEVIDGSVLLVG